ncbi:carbohydrate ABC transporter permease [Angustibacter sp. McL0619]|uniref:carbohydrate ABC transporter permease n=1 Tax=Angustibacter sp. McL0619 TaxID=3415676 RepID=UPI003CEEE1F1
MTATTLRAPRDASRRRSGSGIGRGGPVTYLVAVVFVGACIGPVLYIILGGFRTNAQITVDPSGLPNPWQLNNYLDVLKSSVFWRQAANSVIVAVFTTLGVVVLGVMASFVIARYQFVGRTAMYAFFAAGLMFPMTVAITPLYIMIRNLGLTDSLAGVILPQIAFGLPATIIILVPFLRAIPKELEEAAAIDGASRLAFFFRMVVPLSVPGLVTVGILAFIASWNSYLLPLFLLNNESSYTLPLGVQSFASQYSVDTAKVLAFTSLSMIPALVFFSLFERRIVGGLTGAVKG